MKKGEALVTLEKEIRRLNQMGVRVQEEANMRRFFLACVLSKVGPIEIDQTDIDAMKKLMASGDADLKVEPLAEGREGIRFALRLKNGSDVSSHDKIEPVRLRWYTRLIARVRLWWWGVKVKRA